eukprot:TCONS_00067526-protein
MDLKKYSLAITIIVVYLITIMMCTIWIPIAGHVTFKLTCTSNGSFLCNIWPVVDHSNNLMNVTVLIVAGVWTLFWNTILIGILQISRQIEKSAVFLFQYTLFLQVLMLGVIMNHYVNAFIIQHENDDDEDFYIDRIGEFSSITQQLFLCFYVGFRLYLTYRNNGTMIIFAAYKVFLLVLITGLVFAITYGAQESDIGFMNVACISMPTVTVFFLLYTMCRRSNHQENKIQQHTVWFFFLINLANVISWTILINVLAQHDQMFKMYQNCEEQDNCQFEQLKNSYFVFPIICPSLSAFASIVSDVHLRKMFLQLFNLQKCLTKKPEHRGDENKPLIGPHEQEYDNSRPHQQVPKNWQTQYGAHQPRYESDYHTMPHESPKQNVSIGAHEEKLDIESNFRAMAHEPTEYDVTKGAHK